MSKIKKSKWEMFEEVISKTILLFLNTALCTNFFLEAIPSLKINRLYFSLGILFLIFGITFSIKNFPISNEKEKEEENDNI